ncbi:response regulator [Geotalea uraniireducens]|uniref:Response regulator n=1 Tax=Geotalea uraniireducens TaxID=351604 RepID=A0ABM8EKD2_9BACT|nr:response regulator [Geotalea uraniireducens]BDV42893.1 response regulator [Geotalea uraniireducens]
MTMKSIIIVDDDINYLHILSALLRSKGFNITAATSAAKALDILNNTRFGMIITDYNMPGMDGIKFATRIRETYPDGYIIMITGDISPNVVETATNAGINHILAKPVNVTKLMAIIRSSLRVR